MQDSEIDEKQWLRRGEPIITPERESHGDITIERDEDGNIRFVQRHLNTVLNELHRRGTLDAQHLHDGQTYEVWQTVFRSRLGFRNNPIYQADLAGMRRMVTEDELPTDDFGKLIHRLGAEKCRLIEAAVYEHLTPRALLMIDGSTARFRMAFDRLTIEMEKLREAWRKRNEEQPE